MSLAASFGAGPVEAIRRTSAHPIPENVMTTLVFLAGHIVVSNCRVQVRLLIVDIFEVATTCLVRLRPYDALRVRLHGFQKSLLRCSDVLNGFRAVDVSCDSMGRQGEKREKTKLADQDGCLSQKVTGNMTGGRLESPEAFRSGPAPTVLMVKPQYFTFLSDQPHE
jgi:hypothetical protein